MENRKRNIQMKFYVTEEEKRLYEAKVYFQMTDLLAWTVVIVVCSVGFEKLVLWLLRRCFAAWEGR